MTNEKLIEKIKTSPAHKCEYMKQLYEQNRGFIYETALKFSKNAEIDDFMQEAYIVLDETVRNYKADINIKFITYFGKILKWRFSAYSFCSSVPLKIPLELKELIRKHKQFNQDYFQKHGFAPDDGTCIRALKISKTALENLKIAIIALNTVSFDEPLNDAEELFLQDIIPSEENIEEHITETKENEYYQNCLHKAVEKLSPQKKKAINDFYFENKPFSEIASDLKVSLNYVYTLRTNAIRDLRKDNELYCDVILKGHYDDALSYRYSVGCFKNSGLSSVEVIAIRNEREKNAI